MGKEAARELGKLCCKTFSLTLWTVVVKKKQQQIMMCWLLTVLNRLKPVTREVSLAMAGGGIG